MIETRQAARARPNKAALRQGVAKTATSADGKMQRAKRELEEAEARRQPDPGAQEAPC